MKNVNKEKMFEIEIAKMYGQELVDKIKMLPDETTHDDITYITQKGKNNLIHSCNITI
jgi:hypothetical protein